MIGIDVINLMGELVYTNCQLLNLKMIDVNDWGLLAYCVIVKNSERTQLKKL